MNRHEFITTRAPAETHRDSSDFPMALRAATIDEEKRTVEAVISTDSPVMVFDPQSFNIIDEVLRSDGIKFPDQVPLLDAHDRFSIDSIRGAIRGFRQEKGNIVGTLHFDDDEPSQRAFGKIQSGSLRSVSAGYRSIKFVDIPSGETRKVKGEAYTASNERTLRVSTRWELKEGSLVPIGADPKAVVREQKEPSKMDMTKELRDFLCSVVGMRSDLPEPEAWAVFNGLGGEFRKRAEAVKAGDADPGETNVNTDPPNEASKREDVPIVTPEPVDTAAIARKAVEDERTRQAEISALAMDDVPAELAQRAIAEGWDIDRARGAFLTAIRDSRTPAVGAGGVELGEDQSVHFQRAASDAIGLRAGVPIADPKAQENAEKYTGIGLRDLATLCVRQDGHGGQAPRGPDELFKRAISSGGSFSAILDTSSTKTLAREYTEYPSTLQVWAGERDVANFKEYKDIRLSPWATLSEVGSGGEVEHGVLAENSETYQVTTYGKRYGLTRKDFINDNMGAFLRIPGMMGRAAKRNIDDVGYALLISALGLGPDMDEDSEALFSASHAQSNYSTGSTASALTRTGLTAARKLLRLTKSLADGDGNSAFLNLVGKFILVPASLEDAALEYTLSPDIVLAGTAGAVTSRPNKNIYAGIHQVLPEPRLEGGTNGATAWYLITNPQNQESFIVAYLNGRREPVVERKDPMDVLGIGWWVYHDVGVAPIDWRGIVRSKGA